jgi:hypothetical protein
MGRRRRRIRRLSIEPPTQWFRGSCRCGRILRFRFRRVGNGEAWDVFAYDRPSGEWLLVDERACPTCHQSFAEYSSSELKDHFWPGERAE